MIQQARTRGARPGLSCQRFADVLRHTRRCEFNDDFTVRVLHVDVRRPVFAWRQKNDYPEPILAKDGWHL